MLRKALNPVGPKRALILRVNVARWERGAPKYNTTLKLGRETRRDFISRKEIVKQIII